MLKRFAINEASHVDVAQVLNVDADDIEQALIDFKEKWDEADEPEEADEVIDKWVEFFTAEPNVEDVELMKGNYNTGDTLTWTYNGKEYSCTGEFYVDKDNVLHHTFIAPNGKEIEITTPYE